MQQTLEFYANNKETFYALEAHRAQIEAELGLTCDWQELPSKRASRIQVIRPGDFRDGSLRIELREWVVRTVDDFARVFPKFL
ncbi:MAG: DUF4268 domain-containing protein [Actinobacteria bacterium]|nr:DUF4268 domain-containing protein [Actinomycetota bacterium]